MKLRLKTRKLALSGLFIALGYVLPFFTMQLPALGRMLLPMHIPALLCGFLCGAPYGSSSGLSRRFCAPSSRACRRFPLRWLWRSSLRHTGAWRPLLQTAPAEAAPCVSALILAMLGGRIVWGLASMVIYGVEGNAFTLPMFLSGVCQRDSASSYRSS